MADDGEFGKIACALGGHELLCREKRWSMMAIISKEMMADDSTLYLYYVTCYKNKEVAIEGWSWSRFSWCPHLKILVPPLHIPLKN